jgi:hypothetical protein
VEMEAIARVEYFWLEVLALCAKLSCPNKTAWLSEKNLGSRNFLFVRNPELG